MTSSQLFRKLRVKFIALNMTIAALVLAVAFVTVCAVDHRSTVNEVQQTLESVLDAASMFPHGRISGRHETATAIGPDARSAPDDYGYGAVVEDGAPDDAERDPDDIEEDDGEDGEGDSESYRAPEIGGPRSAGSDSIPVAVYLVQGSGAIQLIGQSNASVSEEVLPEALAQAVASSDKNGYLASSDLFFAKRIHADMTLVAFADGGVAKGWKTLAWGLAGVGGGALVVLFVLNLLFSRWALRPVLDAWQRQRRFIADASHELKTPLTVILANNAVLQRRKDETIESQSQWLESTALEARRMQDLVSDMLELARSDADEAPKPSAPPADTIDFSRVCEGEALTFEAVAFERDISWRVSIAPEVRVRGDEQKLSRTVAALLDNACKYTPVSGCISTTLAVHDRQAVLEVRNTGAVIGKDELEHVFDRFYRADKARTRLVEQERADGSATAAVDRDASGESVRANGYGLGLSIAHDIVVSHKGSISVASSAEEGTVFCVRLPLAS